MPCLCGMNARRVKRRFVDLSFRFHKPLEDVTVIRDMESNGGGWKGTVDLGGEIWQKDGDEQRMD